MEIKALNQFQIIYSFFPIWEQITDRLGSSDLESSVMELFFRQSFSFQAGSSNSTRVGKNTGLSCPQFKPVSALTKAFTIMKSWLVLLELVCKWHLFQAEVFCLQKCNVLDLVLPVSHRSAAACHKWTRSAQLCSKAHTYCLNALLV